MEQCNVVWDGDRELNIRGLLFHILKKWRVIAALVVVGALVGCGASAMKMRQSSAELLKERVMGFTREDVNEEKVRQYADQIELYERQVKHDENALNLKLDPESVWTGGAGWFITADKDSIDEICARFNNALRRDDAFQEIYDRSGLDCSEDDFWGLITFTASKVSPDQSVVGESADNRARYAQVTVSAWYPDSEVCREITDALVELEEKTDLELAAQFPGVYESSQISDYMDYGFSDRLKSAQVSAVETRMKYLETVTRLRKDLSQNELDYYRYYYEDIEDDKQGFSLLLPVELALGLALAGVVWIAFAYILNGHVKNEGELSSMFGLKVVGVVEGEKKYGPIDAWLRKLEHRKNLRAVNRDYLNSYLKTMMIGKTAICLDTDDKEQEKLAQELAQGDKRITVAGDLTSDSAAPSAAAESEGILLLVREGKTAYTELRHIAELANGMGRKIIGAVLIR